MANTLTRRGLVAAAPAAVVAATLPALAAAGDLDAELLALREPYECTLDGVHAVSPAHSRAEDAFYAAKKTHPDLDRAALEKMSGLDLAEAHWQAALEANDEVIRQIIDTRARTTEGFIFKAHICARESLNLDLAESIVADLIALGGANA